MNTPLDITMLFPIPCVDGGVAHTAFETCRHLRGDGITATLITTRVDRVSRTPFVVSSMPRGWNWVPYQWVKQHAANRVERKGIEAMRRSNAAGYLWSDVSPACVEKLHSSGVPLIREKFSLGRLAAHRALGSEYERIGIPWAHRVVHQADVQREREELAMIDFVSSPSPGVTRSMVEMGFPHCNILETSYGWSPQRFPKRARELSPSGGVRVVFVGSLCVGKGVHLLLEAWEQARLGGQLILCGSMEAALRDRYARFLDRDDVVVLRYRKDVSNLYSIADVLVLPSFAEGSPLVVYEAMAHGIPLLLSSMAAGAVVRDGVEGIVCRSHEVCELVAGLRRFATDTEFRTTCGRAAMHRAEEFTWERVGARKRQLFQRAIEGLDSNIQINPALAAAA